MKPSDCQEWIDGRINKFLDSLVAKEKRKGDDTVAEQCAKSIMKSWAIRAGRAEAFTEIEKRTRFFLRQRRLDAMPAQRYLVTG